MNRIKLSGLELKKLSAGLLVSLVIIAIFAITPAVGGSMTPPKNPIVCNIDGPATPSLNLEPAFTKGNMMVLDWKNPDETVVAFFIEVYRAPQQIPPVGGEAINTETFMTSGWITDTFHTFEGLEDGVTYYYRMKSIDQCKQESDWSDFTSSTQDASAPAVPKLTELNERTKSSQLMLTWNPVVDAGVGGVEYLVEVYTTSEIIPTPPSETINEYMPQDNDPVAIADTSGWISGTEYTFEAKNSDTYLFTVKSRDAFGQESEVSNKVRTTIDVPVLLPEETPELPSPPPKPGNELTQADDGIGEPVIPPKPIDDTVRPITPTGQTVERTSTDTQKSTLFSGTYAYTISGIEYIIPE